MGEDSLYSLWWEPFQNTWTDLGYNTYEEMEEDFGSFFFEYDDEAANRVEDKANLAISHAEGKLADFSTKAQLELDMKKRINQFSSEFEIAKAKREDKAIVNQTKRTKAIKTLNALTDMYEASSTYGTKGGVRTGSWDSKKKMAVDSVTSQIDSAMASSSFKRKANRLKLDKLKSETGYYGEDGWVHGSSYLDAQAIMDRDQALRASSTERSEESILLASQHEQEELYNDWIVGSLDMFNTIMADVPEGPNYVDEEV